MKRPICTTTITGLVGRVSSLVGMALTVGALTTSGSAQGPENLRTNARRSVTVTDMIEMTRLGEDISQGGIQGNDSVARFSPDGQSFVVLLKRGDVSTNTNVYWIDYFRTDRAMSHPAPVVIAQFRSTSNRPAIRQLEWRDNHTLSFLAENPGENQQLYTVNTISKRLSRVVRFNSNLTAYAVSPDGKHVVFLAQEPMAREFGGNSDDPSIVIEAQTLPSLLTGKNLFAHEFINSLNLQNSVTHASVSLDVGGNVIVGTHLYMSPDGRYLIVKKQVTEGGPSWWHEYSDRALQNQLNAPRTVGAPELIYQLQLVDLENKTSRPLLDSPIPYTDYPDVVWSPDSKSVVVSNVYLPLSHVDSSEVNRRRMKKFVAEVDVADNAITPITGESLRLESWSSRNNHLIANIGSWSGAGSLESGRKVEYEKFNNIWRQVPAEQNNLSAGGPLRILLEEGMNTPPRLIAENVVTDSKVLLLDLNPQFEELRFGKVEDLGSLSTKGFSFKAGIYLPVNYQPGKRYPLVIQTHEWSPNRFWIDGPNSSGSAAQALAGSGFVVAQIALYRNDVSTLKEVENEAAQYEEVIRTLDSRGMIDPTRIGIVGFSRSALGVKYALIHSKYHFVAATIASGTDVGYFRYVSYLNSLPWQTQDAEGVNGGIPVGEGIRSWIDHGFDFGLDKVSTPVRLEAYEPDSLLSHWEWFGILKRLGRPVDFIYLPTATHVLVRPHDRMVSQEGNLDWFRFWIEGYEDRSPMKREQYERWEHLRELRDSNRQSAVIPISH